MTKVKPLPERLKNLINRTGMLQREVAKQAGVSQQAVSNAVNGYLPPYSHFVVARLEEWIIKRERETPVETEKGSK